MSFDFLFLKKSNQQKGFCYIQMYFHQGYEQLLKQRNIVDNLMKSNFTLGTIRKYFFKSDSKKADTDLDKYFLDIIDRIFKARPISTEFMYKYIVNKIRNDLLNQNNYYFTILDGLLIILFLNKLGLIHMEEVDFLKERIFDEMFEKYGNMFKTPVKRGLFLLGSLTELLLRTQER